MLPPAGPALRPHRAPAAGALRSGPRLLPLACVPRLRPLFAPAQLCALCSTFAVTPSHALTLTRQHARADTSLATPTTAQVMFVRPVYMQKLAAEQRAKELAAASAGTEAAPRLQ